MTGVSNAYALVLGRATGAKSQYGSTARPDYDLAPEGRFLMLKPFEGEEGGVPRSSTEIFIVQNWLENLQRLAPVPEGN